MNRRIARREGIVNLNALRRRSPHPWPPSPWT